MYSSRLGVIVLRVSSSSRYNLMKYVMRGIPVPVIISPMTMNFPAVQCCWVSTNAISLFVQVSFLKIQAVRETFGIGSVRKYNQDQHNPGDLPVKKKGFVDSVKDSWKNVKITKQMQERERFVEMNFKRAGRGPLTKAFKYDPTKIQSKSK